MGNTILPSLTPEQIERFRLLILETLDRELTPQEAFEMSTALVRFVYLMDLTYAEQDGVGNTTTDTELPS
jgi:hypothetical protein